MNVCMECMCGVCVCVRGGGGVINSAVVKNSVAQWVVKLGKIGSAELSLKSGGWWYEVRDQCSWCN